MPNPKFPYSISIDSEARARDLPGLFYGIWQRRIIARNLATEALHTIIIGDQPVPAEYRRQITPSITKPDR